MNPWLYKALRSEYRIKIDQGIPVNQEKFEQFAKDLGYKKYFVECKGINKRKIVDLEGNWIIGNSGEFKK